MKKFFSEFKSFITRGNVIDLAVAVIIGAAFNKITTSLVNDVIMPIISLAVGGLSVSDWKWVITPEVTDANGVVIQAENALRYGNLIQTVLDFLLIALIVFLIMRIAKSADRSIRQLALETKLLTRQQRKELKLQGKTWKEIRAINRQLLEKMEEEEKAKAEAAKKPTTEQLLTEIRDLLKQNANSELVAENLVASEQPTASETPAKVKRKSNNS